MSESRNSNSTNLLEQARRWPWRHKIRVADGFVTAGREDSHDDFERSGVANDLSRLKVLDIGCSDSAHSFMAEERSAQVTSIDNFLTTPYHDGVCGFSIAHDLRASKATLKRMDVYELTEDTAGGQFDVILFFNVLYHLKHPLLALERIRSIANPGATLHLKTIYFQDIQVLGRWGLDLSSRPKMRFLESDELNSDPSNWWIPNKRAVQAMLRATGFTQIQNTSNRRGRAYFRAVAP